MPTDLAPLTELIAAAEGVLDHTHNGAFDRLRAAVARVRGGVMNMREKMTRAMAQADGVPVALSEMPTAALSRYAVMADAALSALEEPTEAMVWAALSRPIAPQASTSDLYRLLFRNMIRAARD